MQTKKEPHSLFDDLEETHVLVSKDKSGTEYWVSKDVSQIDLTLLEERHKAWVHRFLAHHWKQFKFELVMLLDAIWSYLDWRFGITWKR